MFVCLWTLLHLSCVQETLSVASVTKHLHVPNHLVGTPIYLFRLVCRHTHGYTQQKKKIIMLITKMRCWRSTAGSSWSFICCADWLSLGSHQFRELYLRLRQDTMWIWKSPFKSELTFRLQWKLWFHHDSSMCCACLSSFMHHLQLICIGVSSVAKCDLMSWCAKVPVSGWN